MLQFKFYSLLNILAALWNILNIFGAVNFIALIPLILLWYLYKVAVHLL